MGRGGTHIFLSVECEDLWISPPPVLFSLQTGGTGGFDLAGLLNNPGFMSMVNSNFLLECVAWILLICSTIDAASSDTSGALCIGGGEALSC